MFGVNYIHKKVKQKPLISLVSEFKIVGEGKSPSSRQKGENILSWQLSSLNSDFQIVFFRFMWP